MAISDNRNECIFIPNYSIASTGTGPGQVQVGDVVDIKGATGLQFINLYNTLDSGVAIDLNVTSVVLEHADDLAFTSPEVINVENIVGDASKLVVDLTGINEVYTASVGAFGVKRYVRQTITFDRSNGNPPALWSYCRLVTEVQPEDQPQAL